MLSTAREAKAIEPLVKLLREIGLAAMAEPVEGEDSLVRIRLQEPALVLTVKSVAAMAPGLVGDYCRGLRARVPAGTHIVLYVRQLTWPLLNACRQAGVGVYDPWGNAYLSLPGVYIERVRPQSAMAAPVDSGTLFSAKASRAVRALLTRAVSSGVPYTRSELAQATGLTPGYVSVLAKRLIAQGYASDFVGMLKLREPDRLLDDWVSHYRFDRHCKQGYAISSVSYEQGIERLADELRTTNTAFAFSAWTSAYLRAPYTTPVLYTAYVAQKPARYSSIFPVERGGNVLLYTPYDEGVMQFTIQSAGFPIVSDVQTYIDLKCMPGRADDQAEALRHRLLAFQGLPI